MATIVGPCDKPCCSVIESSDHELKSLSQEIWRNPELKYEEHIAHRLLTDYLEEKGFTVERGYCNLPTAFRARSIYSANNNSYIIIIIITGLVMDNLTCV